MAIRTVLTCILTEASASLLSEAASALAARCDAVVIGHHTIQTVVVHPSVAMHIPVETQAALQEAFEADAAAIEAVFRQVTDRVGVRAEWRAGGTVSAADRMIESARSVDLVVMAKPAADCDRMDSRDTLDRVIRNGGRPVLMVPDSGLGDGIGKTVIIGHAGTRESARAAFDVLPLLQDGAEVHLVHVGDEVDELRDWAMTALSAAIARHGHKVNMTHRAPHGASVADMLQAVAGEVGADLIATGAYGHSRTYEFFLGATTGALVRDATLPVLFSA